MEWIKCSACGGPAGMVHLWKWGERGMCEACVARAGGVRRAVRLCDRCEEPSVVVSDLGEKRLRLCRAHAGSLACRLAPVANGPAVG